ncbi:MAG: cytochrome c oxidase subunit II [Acidobacteriota bacterium]
MRTDFPLFPERASTMASQVDALYFYLIAVSAFFALLIAILVIYFAIRYRRRSEEEVPPGTRGGMLLEIAWTVIPFCISMTFFLWGAKIFFRMNRPPDNALQIYVVGKQWMWKLQHADGMREINELHVPVGRPVQLTMTSEDVIHSFFVPAFRMKRDVVPGRYSTVWFEATRPGRFHLFCTQYCGTNHAKMIGWVEVMEPIAYESWISGGGGSESLASEGSKLFQQHACNSCHRPDSLARGPNLQGLFGRHVNLADGRTLVADETYIRESILNPAAKVVEGFQPIMPTYKGLIGEEGILQLIAYVKSVSNGNPAAGTEMLPPNNRMAAPNQPGTEPRPGHERKP